MSVGHGDSVLVDPVEMGDVDALLDSPVGAHFG